MKINDGKTARQRERPCTRGTIEWLKDGYYEHTCECSLRKPEGDYFALEVLSLIPQERIKLG